MSFAAKGKKRNDQDQDKQTPHTVLQKLSPKTTPVPLIKTILCHEEEGPTYNNIVSKQNKKINHLMISNAMKW